MRNLSIRCLDWKMPGQKLRPPRRSSASMSFSRLFLGGLVSTRARLRFTNRRQCAVNSVCRSRNLQRTANYLLTVCLTPGGNPNSSSSGKTVVTLDKRRLREGKRTELQKNNADSSVSNVPRLSRTSRSFLEAISKRCWLENGFVSSRMCSSSMSPPEVSMSAQKRKFTE